MDERLRKLAKSSPNFGVLFSLQPLLAIYGAQAEATVFTSPNASLVQAGQFGEVLAEELVSRTALRVEGTRQVDRLVALTRAGVLVPDIHDDFDRIRRDRNQAAHSHLFDSTRALSAVRTCYRLGLWFHDAINNRRTVAEFVPPTAPEAQITDPAELAELREALDGHRQSLAQSRVRLTESASQLEAERRARAEAESLIAAAAASKEELLAQIEQLTSQVDTLRVTQRSSYETLRQAPRAVDAAARDAIVHRAQRPAPLNEVQARETIDAMLRAAGWQVQDRDQVNPQAAQGVAVREFTIATGRADYVLYIDGKIVGVIEAKREGDHLSDALIQNDRYAAGVLKDHSLAVWRKGEPFAFRYATTGAETYFLNRLDPDARSRETFSFHRPETVARWMQRADAKPKAPTFRAGLRRMPPLEPNGLRLAQLDAISGLEDSLAHDRSRSLIQMATGAGKTYTAVAEAYRLLKYAGARRVLFLVDRNNLGKQAVEAFRNFTTPDDGRKFSEIYNVERLGSAGVQETSSVVVCTIQKMYSLLRGETLTDDDAADEADDSNLFQVETNTYAADQPVEVGYSADVPLESFDLIIVDECHRSIYGLWRGVLEYFDAHLVGLTATPTPQTLGFFGRNLVSEYTYAQAVADGVNVDFDVVRLRSDLREAGAATIESGTTVKIKDRKTRRQRYQELDDDFTYTTRQIGRSVVTVDEIRAVLTTYKNNWQRWFPGRKDIPKTLIFTVGEDHAEDVLAQVKEVFGRGDDFAKKITYKSRLAGENPDDLIRDLRNSPHLRVAVTVDMIATGTDVKALECVIFLREVRSAVLFEQMKGRGARTIDQTELREVTPDSDENVRKERFLLIDAVGVTTSPLVDAKPLVPAGDRQVALTKLLDKAGTKSISAGEAEILAGRLARLNQQLNDEERELLTRTAGGKTVSQIAGAIMKAVDPDRQERVTDEEGPAAARELIERAIAPLADPALRRLIMDIRRDKDYLYDETTQVNDVQVEEVPREERAREEVGKWSRLLKEERDRIAAVDVALSSPRSASPSEAYAALQELAATIRRPEFAWTPASLWTFYEDLGAAVEAPRGSDAGIPDLISLIRFELGIDEELRPYRSVVEERFEAWLLRQGQAGAEFSNEQMWWLERIRDVVASDVGIGVEEFRREPFTERGGGRGFKHAFSGRDVRALVNELNRELA
ncbi:type I restriction endonuclease subunit R [Streptomyces lunaelactis]|uniref:type I restriction endonuclease subunit R n=1 Tax=Streptomyces lunaelactis TaxID=1535768 RepID=UPI0015856234|nr:DEAD/DEAH box helicase family protein [Streptomyces lunaelactis]NUK04759.1 DEAD/DEAH box helicase family protein [Streptomyces lunaelactis]NUK19676.1 DEAD/DEAH box helicase family protein [Streptomyces lunaelactis]